MKRFFMFLLLCLVLMAGAWVGRSILPPPPAWELPSIVDTIQVERVVYKDSPAVVKLDTINLNDTELIDSMLAVIDIKEDTILTLINYLEELIDEDDSKLIASHDTTVALEGASWDQYTSYDYGSRSFNFMYDNMRVPVKFVSKGTNLHNLGVTVAMTSTKNIYYGINYGWVAVGMSTDNTFYLGLHITWSNIKELIGGLKQ